jgi:hypothetical protein
MTAQKIVYFCYNRDNLCIAFFVRYERDFVVALFHIILIVLNLVYICAFRWNLELFFKRGSGIGSLIHFCKDRVNILE